MKKITVKKAMALILSLSLLLTLSLSLVGCKQNGEEGTTADGEKTSIAAGSNKSTSGTTNKDVYIDFYGAGAADEYKSQWIIKKMDDFVKDYEKKNGISVQMDYIPNDSYETIRDKLVAGAVSKELPVMAQLEESYVFQLRPICTDLTEYLPKEVIDNYLDGLMVSCRFDKNVYAVPYGRSYVVLFVNETLLKQAGHTYDDLKNWNDIGKVAKDISALGDDINGFGVFWDTDAWFWESVLYANGGQVCTDDGKKVTFADNDVGAIYMAQVKDMLLNGSAIECYDKAAAANPADALRDLFLKQKLGLFLTTCTAYGGLKNAIKSGDYDKYGETKMKIIDQPAGIAGNHVVTGGTNFIVSNTATDTQKRVAAAFLEFIAKDQNVAEWSALSGYLAFTKSVYNSAYYEENAKDPNLVQIAKGIQYAHPRPQTSHWGEMNIYIVDKLQVFSMHPEQFDPVKLNREMAQECQKIIDDAE